MSAEYEIADGVDERIERLICRSLDGELTADEHAELAGLLRTNPAARRLLEEYGRIDQLTVHALRRDFESAKAVAAAGRSQIGRGGFRGIRLAAAGAVLTAAAVVALSFLPELWSKGSGDDLASGHRATVLPTVGQPMLGGPQQFVDYREDDYLPQRRQRDVIRDLIGVRGKNEKNRDVIYIFERNTQSTRITPISGDF